MVIETGTIRKLGCGFLFAFHSNYGCILHPGPIYSYTTVQNFMLTDATVAEVSVTGQRETANLVPCHILK